MNIRIMTMDDYDSIYQLWIRTPGLGLNTTDDSREGIAKYLKRNPRTCFVAEMEGKIVGAILTGHDGRRGTISHTVVDVNYRLHGIATALVDAAMNALKDEGITKVNLVAFKKNEVANNFWEAYGFTTRDDLNYRNKCIIELQRIDT